MQRAIKLILIFILFNLQASTQNIISQAQKYTSKENIKKLLFISIKEQKLYYIKDNKIINTYLISSSKHGTGNKSGSNKTPIGLHKIKKKYGEATPIYGKMIGRKYYGEKATIFNDNTQSKTDDITSRILWLEGIEQGINKGRGIDSYKRYIYIHGTSEEGRIGQPASHGCIRMLNKEVIDLYNNTEVGTLVLIL